jgi:hypothetical protein
MGRVEFFLGGAFQGVAVLALTDFARVQNHNHTQGSKGQATAMNRSGYSVKT